MFGLIFHWGIYSVPAFCRVKISNKGLNNGSEWYLKRLSVKENDFRPISGYKETQKYHSENYGEKEYSEFKDDFKAEKWNPDEWMKFAIDIGAEYVIITSKHHDGYCLWDTNTTNYNSVESGSCRDLVSEFGISAKKYNLKFGIYYSWSEFGKGCTKNYLNDVVNPQINELLKYNPDIWWFDGHWECKTKYSIEFVSKMCKKMKEHNPNVQINDRLGGAKEYKEKLENINFLGESTYRSYGDREIPVETPTIPWEHINTIGYSWGRNKQQLKKHYKSGEELYELYKKVSLLKGNFLLNLGPNSDGTLDENEVESLIEFGKILKSN